MFPYGETSTPATAYPSWWELSTSTSFHADLTLRTDNFSRTPSTHWLLLFEIFHFILPRLSSLSLTFCFNYDTTTCRLEPVYKYEEDLMISSECARVLVTDFLLLLGNLLITHRTIHVVRIFQHRDQATFVWFMLELPQLRIRIGENYSREMRIQLS